MLERELASNRGWLRQWEATNPHGPVSFDTRASIRALLVNARGGSGLPFAIEVDGEFAGQLNVSSIAYGSLSSASIGYWVAERFAGRNVTPTAVALATDHSSSRSGLHRMEICIRPENAPSLRVDREARVPLRGAAPPVHPHQRRLARPLLLRADRRGAAPGRAAALEGGQGAGRRRRAGATDRRAEGAAAGLERSARTRSRRTGSSRSSTAVTVKMPIPNAIRIHRSRAPHDGRDAEQEQRDRHQRGVEPELVALCRRACRPRCAGRRISASRRRSR